MNKIHCSVGIIVYNEAENILRLINALQNQRLNTVVLDEIIVVSSACTDGTDDLVRKEMSRDSNLKLITEKERNGKSAAINKFIEASNSEVLVIESGDTLPAEDTLERMVAVFADSKVGMSGGRPLPENDRKTFCGRLVHILWEMHHRMALISPKLGEMVAFRNILAAIPSKSAVDEASIEAQIKEQGLCLVYVPEAIVYNKGPEKFQEYMSQRRRIASGHLWLKSNQKYNVASQDSGILFKIFWQQLRVHPGEWFYLILNVKIELLCRFLGWWDLRIRRKNPFKWDIAASSKKIERKL